MLEYETISLKRGRSPSKSSAPPSPKSISVSPDQVSSLNPCMFVERGGKPKLVRNQALESIDIPFLDSTGVLGKTRDTSSDSGSVGKGPVEGKGGEGVLKAGCLGEVKVGVSGEGGLSVSVKAPGVSGVVGAVEFSGRVQSRKRDSGGVGGSGLARSSTSLGRSLFGGQVSGVVGGMEESGVEGL